MFTVPAALVGNLGRISIVGSPGAVEADGVDLAGVRIGSGLPILQDRGRDAQRPGEKGREQEAGKPHGAAGDRPGVMKLAAAKRTE